MRLETACEPIFARHETFHPRYGWAKKAHDAADRDHHVFNRDEAVLELGVGKNMVKSIRHWGLAFKVLAPQRDAGTRVPLAVPSRIGRAVFADDGWDPYCELTSTLWLLHWWLQAPPSIAPIWWLAFNEFPGVEFTAEQVEQFVADRAKDWAAPHPTAVKKDVACLLRMFSSGEAVRATFDDLVDCPFRDLGLLRPSTTVANGYRFLIGPKPTLAPSVAAFACLDFIARAESEASTATVSKLATEQGSPGRVFKLTESALTELLQQAATRHEEIELTTSAGVPMLSFDESAARVATEILRDHYQDLTSHAFLSLPAFVSGLAAGGPAGRPAQLALEGVA